MESEQKILLRCPCGKSYRVPASMAGKRGRCPACGMVVRVNENNGPAGKQRKTAQGAVPPGAPQTPQTPPFESGAASPPKPQSGGPAVNPVNPQAQKGKQPPAGKSKPSLLGKLKGGAPKSQAQYLSKLKGIKNKVDTKILGEKPDEGKGVKRYDYNRLSKLFFTFLLIFCLAFAGYLGKLYFDGAKAGRAYKQLGQQIAKAQSLEQRQILYQGYIAAFRESRHTVDVREELAKVPALMDTRDFENAEKEAQQAGANYEEIERIYLDYVKRHPKGQYLDKVQTALSALPQKVEYRDYKNAVSAFENAGADPDNAENALNEYLQRYPKGEHTEEIVAKLKQIPVLKDELGYQNALAATKEMGDNFQEWRKPLSAYLEQFPRGKHTAEVRNILESIPVKLDEAAYAKALESDSLPFLEREKGYKEYLAQYPQGLHVAEINERIENIPNLWAQQVIEDIEKLDNEMRWPEAIDQCQAYLRVYPNSLPSSRLEKYVRAFRRKMGTASEEMDFRKVQAVEKQPGADLNEAKQAYLKYLEDNPNGMYRGEAEKSIKRLDVQMMTQTWEKLRKDVMAPGADPQRSMESVNLFLTKHPKGDHVDEAREIMASLSKRFETENEPAVWDLTLRNVQNASSLGDALRAIDYFLRKYPNGTCKEKALQKIVELEMRRYSALSPFPVNQAVCTVEIRGKEKQQGYKLTGQLREIDSETYVLRDQANDAYYIKKADVLGIVYSPQAEYNKLLASRPPRASNDFLNIAKWSERAGFNDKRLINLVMAAYLNPNDSRINQTLASNGFSFANGRWKSNNGVW